MCGSTKRTLFTAGILLVLLCHGRATSAQCSSVTLQFGRISSQRGNPFQAEYSTTLTPAPLAGAALLPPLRLYSVARDSEGRVREERVAGKFKVKTTDGAESEQEQHFITICDPVSQKMIRLDTLNKTATVQSTHFGLLRPVSPLHSAAQPFCASLFARYRPSPQRQTEDLGSQTISGVQTQGVRRWLMVQISAGSETQPRSSFQDEWCSDDLGAVVMQVFVSSPAGHRNETVLKNIERTEPDAALFQIPADYTIEERAMNNNLRPGLRLLQTSPASSTPQ